MRLWSLHPRYVDPQGLVALWRETLLAQAGLRGETRGYRNHPQMDRFKACSATLSAISLYLKVIQQEATERGYSFDKSKIHPARKAVMIPVTSGQVAYEWQHLTNKLKARNPEVHERWKTVKTPELHPLFHVVPGDVEPWEKQ